MTAMTADVSRPFIRPGDVPSLGKPRTPVVNGGDATPRAGSVVAPTDQFQQLAGAAGLVPAARAAEAPTCRPPALAKPADMPSEDVPGMPGYHHGGSRTQSTRDPWTNGAMTSKRPIADRVGIAAEWAVTVMEQKGGSRTHEATLAIQRRHAVDNLRTFVGENVTRADLKDQPEVLQLVEILLQGRGRDCVQFKGAPSAEAEAPSAGAASGAGAARSPAPLERAFANVRRAAVGIKNEALRPTVLAQRMTALRAELNTVPTDQRQALLDGPHSKLLQLAFGEQTFSDPLLKDWLNGQNIPKLLGTDDVDVIAGHHLSTQPEPVRRSF